MEYGFCFIYVGFLLMLPFDQERMSGLLIAFVLGLIMDLYYQSGGIHSAACVFLMFVRPALLSLLNPKSGFELGMRLTVSQMGWLWYLLYAAILVFIHHLILYSLDAFNFAHIARVFMQTIVSTFFTISMILTVQLLLFSRVRT